jgi:two-component system, cell cycle sensor histidine kinase and response regulator CckA
MTVEGLGDVECLYDLIAESTPDFIFIVGLDFRVQYVNPAGARLFGRRPQELVGIRVDVLFPGEVGQRQMKSLGRVFSTGETLYLEDLSMFPERALWLDSVLIPLKDTGGRTVSVLGTSRDITRRKTAELGQAAEHERLNVTLRSIGDAVVATDTAGRITTFNRAAEVCTGLVQTDVVGRAVHDVFPALPPAADAPDSWVLRRPDGTPRSIESTAAPIRDEAGVDLGLVWVMRDVTDRERIEVELGKAQKLESLATLAGGIAHDFNNLLTAITGGLSLCRYRLDSGKDVRELLEDIERASARARALTHQLLTFSRGGAPVRSLTAIGELARQIALFTLSGSSVNCELQLPHDLWLADVDTGQISQVVQNLVLNAAQAMPNGGTLRVSGANVSLDGSEPVSLPAGRYICLSVADQGPGIAAEHRERIFDPFFTTKEQGSGLGLSITYSIVRRHGGLIRVDSVAGAGATFHVYLPAHPSEVGIPAETKPELATGAGRVLVVDDEDSVRQVTRKALTTLGYEVTLASDGNEAIALYREAFSEGHRFDVVVMDLTIPGGMGGKDAIGRLRDLDPDVRAIVASGYSNDPIMADHQRYGFCGKIAKPFTLRDLGMAVERAAGRNSRPRAPGR